jgi:hypothetical protein
LKAEIILKYKAEDKTDDHIEIVDVSCVTELQNLAYGMLAQTKNDPSCIPAIAVNFNFVTEEE